MRDCPTVEGSSIPLIIHRIAAADCMQRQACNYHKCHRCIFRGKAASWAPAENGIVGERAATTGERAVPARMVEVPRPDQQKAPKVPPRKPRKNAPPAPSPS